MIRRPPRSTLDRSSAASDVYKRQIFSECDLSKTLFENTNLSKCDFRTSFNYSIDPDKNKIAKAKFSAQNVSGLLDKYNIVIE